MKVPIKFKLQYATIKKGRKYWYLNKGTSESFHKSLFKLLKELFSKAKYIIKKEKTGSFN